MRQRAIATACVLAALAFLLYSRNTRGPLNDDERALLEQAQTVRTSTPLFFHVADERWLPAAPVYATALVHALGGGERSGRIASAIVGVADVVLVYVAVGALTHEWIAVAAALVLLLTPTHFWFARLGTEALFPAPFVLLWMIAMLRFIQRDSPKSLTWAAVALGVGVYTHPVAPLTMAWLWLISLAALIAWRRVAARNLIALGGAFTLVLIPVVAWYLTHPSSYADTFGRWALFPAHARFPLDGLRAQINWNTVGTRSSVLWGLFDPSFLLFPGDGQRVAPFLACSGVLVLLGMARAVTTLQPAQRLVVLAAVLVPPVIASTFGQPHALAMVSPLIPTAAVAAGLGLASPSARTRYGIVAIAVTLAISAQQIWTLYHS